jgi:hypothetical protein
VEERTSCVVKHPPFSDQASIRENGVSPAVLHFSIRHSEYMKWPEEESLAPFNKDSSTEYLAAVWCVSFCFTWLCSIAAWGVPVEHKKRVKRRAFHRQSLVILNYQKVTLPPSLGETGKWSMSGQSSFTWYWVDMERVDFYLPSLATFSHSFSVLVDGNFVFVSRVLPMFIS